MKSLMQFIIESTINENLEEYKNAKYLKTS